MAGPNLTALSSNWKKLQEKLQPDKPKISPNNGLKRKREPEKKTSIIKKTKISVHEDGKTNKRPPKMGSYFSTTPKPPSAVEKTATLINDHDIDSSSIQAAYGLSSAPSATLQHSEDVVNGGHHTTHRVGKYVSLDCEMVGTGPPPHTDNVLARASLTNYHGEQVYDSYVQAPPGIRVEDYRTHVSGIKPHHMRSGFARPFAEVQRDVAGLLDGRILVGHALRNDLNALILSHPKRDMRDTSRYPKFRIESRGKPPALRKLAKSELGLDIQTGEHSSVEDARATMMLFKKEKVGLEEENRKTFGQTRMGKGGKGKEKDLTPSVEDEEGDVDEEDDEDLDDLDVLDGEDDAEVAQALQATRNGPSHAKSKKRKKKKRTKRS